MSDSPVRLAERLFCTNSISNARASAALGWLATDLLRVKPVSDPDCCVIIWTSCLRISRACWRRYPTDTCRTCACVQAALGYHPAVGACGPNSYRGADHTEDHEEQIDDGVVN